MAKHTPVRGSEGAAPYLPAKLALKPLAAAVQSCHGCDLYRAATQAVFGEGREGARVLLVGEQPGNEEDLRGAPFVGPAGKVLDRALADAGIERQDAFVTNAVKHFKFEERGKRRIHKKPGVTEVNACKPWLEAEVLVVKPKVIVCLGATAVQSVLGKGHLLTKERGTFVEHRWADYVTCTIHPSAVLRAPTSEARHAEYAGLVEDLRKVREVLGRVRLRVVS